MTKRVARLIFAGFLTIVFMANVIVITAQPPRLKRNGKIAFTSGRDANREIYVMNPDGTNQTRLTNNNTIDDYARWSPDGQRIAFLGQRGTGEFGLFVMNADGTGRTEITNVTYDSLGAGWSLSWSPDGRSIVFQDYDPFTTEWLVIVNADGSNRRHLVQGYVPAWSPDGSKILFLWGDGNLGTIHPDGGDFRILPLNSSWHDPPVWHPSGSKIAFSTGAQGYNVSGTAIYTANADGLNSAQITADCVTTKYLALEGLGSQWTTCEGRMPDWSPDGRRFAFVGLDSVIFPPGPISNGSNPDWQSLPKNPPLDYDGDGKSDVSTFRPANGVWYLNRSADGTIGLQWGTSADKIAPADYDGDGSTDVAVFRPSEGRWYILNSSTSTFSMSNWGLPTDIPAPGDFDNDGRADVAIFRPSEGSWWINRSAEGTLVHHFGANGDHPVAGDYDGDGFSDIAVFRSSTGVWYVNRSTAGLIGYQFGLSTDKVTPADYDGDGKTDIGVYRPSEGKWYIANSGSAVFPTYSFGASTDIPTPADYDGDGRADIAIFRPSDGNWWISRTTAGLLVQQFGQNSDRPTPSGFGN